MSIFKIAQWLKVWQMVSECCIYAEILFDLMRMVEKAAFLQKCTIQFNTQRSSKDRPVQDGFFFGYLLMTSTIVCVTIYSFRVTIDEAYIKIQPEHGHR